MKSKVSLVRCEDYTPVKVEQAVRKAVDLLGGVTNLIKPGSKVLVKPNLLMAVEPETGIVTHPEIVRAVIHILKDINARIFLGDSPSAWGGQIEQIELVWERSGIKRIAQEEKVELVRFERTRWYEEFALTTWIDEVDYIVSLPKFKTHDLTILTGAIKNLFGLVVGLYKTELHRRYFTGQDFAKMLADLYQIVKPTLSLVDGVLALEGDGPATAGKPKNLGLILAGTDAVSIDSVLALIMGLRPLDILTTQEASRRNLGNSRIEDIEILGEDIAEVIREPFKLPKTWFKYKLPRPFIELAKKIIRFYPDIDSRLCSLCGACILSCPQKVIKCKDNRMVINYSGCIACFCCQESCPEGAITIKRSLIVRLLNL